MVVGHPFLLAYNQQKYVAMKRLDKELRLRLIVPSSGRDRFEWTTYEVHPELCSEEIVALQAHMARSHMTYVHALRPMASVLRDFQPDVIHVEEEPQALITVETILLRNFFAPGAVISSFSWDNILRPRRFPIGAAKRMLRAYSLRKISLMICGNWEAAELLRAEARFRGSLEILPQYGLDVKEHQPGTEPQLRAELGLQGIPVIGYVGRMVSEKGLRVLFEALAHLQNYPWKLLLVGSGPLEREIREQWMASLPGRIVLVNAVPYEQVPRYLRCTDIFVLASQSTPVWKEQFGLALAQAMMLGIASTGSKCGAIPETLGPGGAVFEQHDAEGLRHILENWLTSPASRARAAAAGRDHALRNYTIEHVAEQYLHVLERARICDREGHAASTNSLELQSLERKF
jgi:glycosyltransferase involved in cell wall biosynthesis